MNAAELILSILSAVLGSGLVATIVFYRPKRRKADAEAEKVEITNEQTEVDRLEARLKLRDEKVDSMYLGLRAEQNARHKAERGTTVVVHSVDFFPSLMELLGTLAELQERGIALKSLQEPWLSEEVGSTANFLLKLRELALLLHKTAPAKG